MHFALLRAFIGDNHRMARKPTYVHVVDGWDDSEGESYVRVFSTAAKAKRDVERWRAERAEHDVYVGVVRRRVL